MTEPRVIGVGQKNAGDDGVGLAVAEHLRVLAPANVVVLAVDDVTDLVELVQHDAPVVIVDALGSRRHPPGTILSLSLGELDIDSAVSSHGVSVKRAVELAQVLAPHDFTPKLQIVGIVIAEPEVGRRALSFPVAEAVPVAARRILEGLGVRQS